MSITCNSCLLLFLLCLSLHACNARRLSSIDNKIPQVQKSLFSTKDQEGKSGFDEIAVSEVECSPPPPASSNKENGEDNSVVKANQNEEKDHHQNLKDKKVTSRKGTKSSVDSTVETKSLVSVSWRVPPKKRGEKHLGFNLDYSPPKTHPPSHN